MMKFTKVWTLMTVVVAPLAFAQDKIAPANPAAPAGSAPASPAAPIAPPPGQRPPPPGLGNPAARPVQRFDRFLQDLTEEQKTKINEINKTYTERAMPLYARLQNARRELESSVNLDQTDEAGLRAKAKEVGDLEADLAVARAQRYAKFRAFLTPDQAKRLNQPTPLARPFQPALHEGQPPPPIAPNK